MVSYDQERNIISSTSSYSQDILNEVLYTEKWWNNFHCWLQTNWTATTVFSLIFLVTRFIRCAISNEVPRKLRQSVLFLYLKNKEKQDSECKYDIFLPPSPMTPKLSTYVTPWNKSLRGAFVSFRFDCHDLWFFFIVFMSTNRTAVNKKNSIQDSKCGPPP